MECNNTTLLWRYADGELDEAATADLYAHLQACAGCASELNEVKTLAGDLGAVFDAAPFGEALVGRTMARLRSSGRQPVARPPRRRSFARFAIAAALMAAVGAGWFLARTAPTQAPVVASVSGDGWLLDGSDDDVEGDVLRGAVLTNASDAGRVLVFNDGSRVTVAPDSKVRVSEEAGRGRLELVGDGAVFADVSHQDSRFEVRSGDLVVEVLGTRFAVESTDGARRVRLYEGYIRCSADGVEDMQMKAGQELRVDAWQVDVLAHRDGLDFYPDAARLPLPGPAAVPGASPTVDPVAPVPHPDWPTTPAPTEPPTEQLDVPVDPPVDRANPDDS